MSEQRVTITGPSRVAAEQYERMVVKYTMTPFAIALLEDARLRPGERVADIACGTGIVARMAAPVVGETGMVAAVDINPSMLMMGQAQPTAAGAAIEWREGDATRLPLGDAAFDVVLCQQGLQFFDDRMASLREMRRILAPGGRICLAVFDRLENNPVWSLIWNTTARRLDVPVMTLAHAFSLGDAEEVRALLEGAGFCSVVTVARAFTLRQPLEDDLVAKTIGGLRSVLEKLEELSPDEVATLARSVEVEIGDKLRAYQEDGWQLFPVSLHYFTALKPG